MNAAQGSNGVKAIFPEMTGQELNYSRVQETFSADRWFSLSTLALLLVPLGIWSWWAVINAVISLF